MMKKLMIFAIMFGVLAVAAVAQIWVKDPTTCPASYLGVNCGANEVCGYLPPTQCNDNSLIAIPAVYSPTYQTQESGSGLATGYVLNCLAIDGSNPPYCDLWKCQINNTCYATDLRITNCTSTTDAPCGACRSGYLNCTGDVTTPCEIQVGESCTITASGLSGTCQACLPDTGTDGGGNSCNCVGSPVNFQTGVNAQYSTANPLLWGTQFGIGWLANLTSSVTLATFGINGSGCIVFPDNTTQCTAGGNGTGYWNQTGANLTPANTSWNVGIGTPTPTAKLHVLVTNQPAAILGDANTVATGWFSVAMGFESNASANYAFATGLQAKASNSAAFSAGFNTQAAGEYSTALGRDTYAGGQTSFATGYKTNASWGYATAMGRETNAKNYYATALGYQTTASGQSSISAGEGVGVEAGSNQTFVFGRADAGTNVRSDGDSYGSIVTGYAEGVGSILEVNNSCYGCIIHGYAEDGNITVEPGQGLTANYGSVARGWVDQGGKIYLKNAIGSLAQGSSAGSDSYILAGATGAGSAAGSIASGGATGTNGIIYATGIGSFAMGRADFNTITSGGLGSFAMGFAVGPSNHVISSGRASFAMGTNVSASGDYSFVFGNSTKTATPNRAKFFGNGTGAAGRFGINRGAGTVNYPLHIGTNVNNGNGAYLSDAGLWESGCSREFKEDYKDTNSTEILQKIRSLDIKNYKYKGNNTARHISPFAEDVYYTFGVGDDPQYLSGIDTSGIALVAIQELSDRNDELKAENQMLKERMELLEQAIFGQ